METTEQQRNSVHIKHRWWCSMYISQVKGAQDIHKQIHLDDFFLLLLLLLRSHHKCYIFYLLVSFRHINLLGFVCVCAGFFLLPTLPKKKFLPFFSNNNFFFAQQIDLFWHRRLKAFAEYELFRCSPYTL